MQIKDYIGQSLVNKKLHITCDCLIKMDVVGVVTSYKIKNNEIIWVVFDGKKTIEIGENHPNLNIDIL